VTRTMADTALILKQNYKAKKKNPKKQKNGNRQGTNLRFRRETGQSIDGEMHMLASLEHTKPQ